MIRSPVKTDVRQEFDLQDQDSTMAWLEWANERVNITGQFSDNVWLITWLKWADGDDHGKMDVWVDGELVCHTYPEEII